MEDVSTPFSGSSCSAAKSVRSYMGEKKKTGLFIFALFLSSNSNRSTYRIKPVLLQWCVFVFALDIPVTTDILHTELVGCINIIHPLSITAYNVKI